MDSVITEKLMQLGIEPTTLPTAPRPEPTRTEYRARICVLPLPACAVCGGQGITTRVIQTTAGPRWLDLCLPDVTAVMPPSRMPATLEGILADLREVAAEVAADLGIKATLSVWTDETGWQDEQHG
ncbi:hypothetical protein ACIGMX_34715 [Streptomyces aquilus]|uniref:hypothetical protein n=1 Tax=Streptomyces aquilus TaxID=2548456 RepID=UPI0037CEECC3